MEYGAGDMHEWLISRGDVRGVPYEYVIQIFVPVNVVIAHPGHCHQKLQFGEVGARMCLNYILEWHSMEEIEAWLTYLLPYMTIAEEKLRWLRV